MVGMLLVNFWGSFDVSPAVLKHHHDYCSYADTIMPQFLFAVGFAFRLTFGRRVRRDGWAVAYPRMVRRLLGLVLVSFAIYHVSAPAGTWAELVELGPARILPGLLKRSWFQTLMHIAVTSLWILPVICASARIRVAWMLGGAVLHVLLSYWFNYEWVNSNPNAIDGGPLGFLTWSVPALCGTFACDVIVNKERRLPLTRLVGWSAGLMILGYVMSCGTRFYDVPKSVAVAGAGAVPKLADSPVWPTVEQRQLWSQGAEFDDWLAEPPFVAPPDQRHRQWNYWMMSQRGGTLSYVTFSAGISIIVFVLFYVACDTLGWHWSVFRTFGTNALAAYVLHDLVAEAVKPFIPRDSPGWYVATGLCVFFIITWSFVRGLEKQNVYLKV